MAGAVLHTAIGGFFLPGEWYAGLRKPSWNPPNWIFGPVWTVLYATMAVAAWLVWKRGDFSSQRFALSLFLMQLFLNALWSPLFFGLRNTGLAFVDIVLVVMGVGFVGAVMAAIIADTTDAQGRNSKFVIGFQRPSARSYWKIPLLNRGESPVTAEDPVVGAIIRRCVTEKQTLVATYTSECLSLADCVVVDVQCDYTKHDLGDMRTGETEMAALEETMRTIGRTIPPSCLVLIETTVAPGTTEFVAWPILKKSFAQRA